MIDISPMLASIGHDVPAGRDWVFEPKYDGIRLLAFASNDGVALVSRNGLDKTAQFPEVVEALRALRAKRRRDFVLDGEVVVMRDGLPLRFQEMQSRMHVTDARAIARHRESLPAALFAFDILLDGRTSVVTEPWRARRKRLAAVLASADAGSDAVRLSVVGDDGEAMLHEAREHGWEGVIAKRANAPYEVGARSKAWLKLKLDRRQEFVVGGWTEPRNAREHLGALLLGYYSADGELIYAGHTGTGFTRESLAAMSKRLSKLERATSPFRTRPKTNQPAHWTRPEIVVEIKFTEWTAGGHLRQPVFLGVRDDRSPREVSREPQSDIGVEGAVAEARDERHTNVVVAQLDAIERAGGSGSLDLPTGALDVANLDKVFWTATTQTKGDLLRYYAQMAPYILPAIADRPLVMKRFPNGVRGKAFYQQKAPANAPASVRVERVSDEGMETADRLVGGDLATLLYVAQLGAISIDPWHSRVQSVQYADYSIIDLDPGPKASFSLVIDVALAVKEALDALRLHAVPKTSGASGLHIVLPLPKLVTNDSARIIAEVVATHVAERHPKIATVERWTKQRPSSAIYVDFLQNIRGKTVAGVYSVRAQSRPTVSTPLEWSEVAAGLDPAAFTIDTVPARVRERGDLWAKGMKTPNSLAHLVSGGGGA